MGTNMTVNAIPSAIPSVIPRSDEWLDFVVLRHSGQDGISDHYDIALNAVDIHGQDGSEALTLDKMETTDPLNGDKIRLSDAMLIRQRYLGYEGEMRGNRGNVSRFDSGRYRFTNEGQMTFEGNILRGTYQLRDDGDGLVMERV
jgi:hypothetical protein